MVSGYGGTHGTILELLNIGKFDLKGANMLTKNKIYFYNNPFNFR